MTRTEVSRISLSRVRAVTPLSRVIRGTDGLDCYVHVADCGHTCLRCLCSYYYPALARPRALVSAIHPFRYNIRARNDADPSETRTPRPCSRTADPARDSRTSPRRSARTARARTTGARTAKRVTSRRPRTTTPATRSSISRARTTTTRSARCLGRRRPRRTLRPSRTMARSQTRTPRSRRARATA